MNRDLYYLENDKIVFTSEYHIERGYCCGSKCRHCPYIPKYEKENIVVDTEKVKYYIYDKK